MIDKIRKYDLEIVVFVCGGVVMVFELIFHFLLEVPNKVFY